MNPTRLLRCILLATLAICCSPRPAAGQTRFTLFTNGPTAKRLNVVVLSEGYTTNQLNLFLTDATNAINSLLAQAPYQEYKNYFNAYGIFVASVESGSDHHAPSGEILKNTYFNSTFDSYGNENLLTIPPNDWNASYAQGQGKVDSLLATLMPEYDLALMVVNDVQYGGSGASEGGSGVLVTSVNLFSPEIIVHESGHTLGGLTDEYSDPYPAALIEEKPNATATTVSNSIKWRAWIPSGTLIPTPQVASNSTRIGLFQGAQYHTTGWYRPKMDCKMNHLFVPFCEVCSEQLVKSIYGQVRPVDGYAPATTNLTLYSTQAITFSVGLLQPTTHNLNVQWFTNNTAIAGATNPSFSLSPKSLGNGVHSLKALISDPTSLVRTDPSGVLKQTNTWNLTVSLNELALVSSSYLGSNRFRFTVTGAAPAGFVIQASTNLINWTPLSTNNLSAGKYDFTNSNLTNFTGRFYRTVSPP